MKSIAIFLCLTFGLLSSAQGDSSTLKWKPLGTDNVFRARVVSIIKSQVTFSVEETITGKPLESLTLTNAPDLNIQTGTEWILLSYGPEEWLYHQGTLLSKDREWAPLAVRHQGTVAYIQTEGVSRNGITLDTLPDGTKGLTIEHLRDLFRNRP
jgi:hypothetical protein